MTVMSTTATSTSEVQQYLQNWVHLRRASMRLPEKYKYHGVEDFVLQHGRPYLYRPLPAQYKLGPLQACYENAVNLVIHNPHTLTYVEGYAAGVIPVLHAWCVDQEGYVVEPTWRQSQTSGEYFGVPFNMKYILKIQCQRKCYGILDNYENGYPLLTVRHRDSAGKLHREDGPASDWADGTKYWYLHGERHREDGPAVVWANGDKAWYLHGVKVNGKEYEHVRTCPLEELPEYIGTEYECVATKRLGK